MAAASSRGQILAAHPACPQCCRSLAIARGVPQTVAHFFCWTCELFWYRSGPGFRRCLTPALHVLPRGARAAWPAVFPVAIFDWIR
jgi:hypothetical protein